jgi:hypothetical protein
MMNIGWDGFFALLKEYDKPENIVYGVPKGGMIAAGFLKQAKITHDPFQATMILDDVIDSGVTRAHYLRLFPHLPFYA